MLLVLLELLVLLVSLLIFRCSQASDVGGAATVFDISLLSC